MRGRGAELDKLKVLGFLRKRPDEYFTNKELADTLLMDLKAVGKATAGLANIKVVLKEGEYYGYPKA